MARIKVPGSKFGKYRGDRKADWDASGFISVLRKRKRGKHSPNPFSTTSFPRFAWERTTRTLRVRWAETLTAQDVMEMQSKHSPNP